MKKLNVKSISGALLLMLAMPVQAEIPAGYYNSLGGKSGVELMEAAGHLADGHKTVSYGKNTWEAFITTDSRILPEGNFGSIWYDIYSNNIRSIANGYGGMNIEHSVANSWWGGVKSVGAYTDLFNLNPSDADANNRKSDNPFGEIEGTPTWTNGVTSIGAPNILTGGGAKSVFEPADWFKGDFARACFYVFTSYRDIDWQESSAWMYYLDNGFELRSWAVEMLLDWARRDPVDSREIERNNAVYGIQNNRNPFIDIPDLAEYIWGNKKGETLSVEGLVEPKGINAPAAPVAKGYAIAGVNTYQGRIWDAVEVELENLSGNAFVSYDGGEWLPLEGNVVSVAECHEAGARKAVQVYVEQTVSGYTLTSPVMTLNLVARDPEKPDYSAEKWYPVEQESQIGVGKQYVVYSTEKRDVMGLEMMSSSSSKALAVAGTLDSSDFGGVINYYTSLPEQTAVLTLEAGAEGGYNLLVTDIAGESKGYLNVSAAKKMSIAGEATPATVTLSNPSVVIDFGSELGRLQYNSQQPRFSVYTTNQQPVSLLCLTPVKVGIEEVAPVYEGKVRVFDLYGTEHNADNLEPGLYIIIKEGKARKVLVR